MPSPQATDCYASFTPGHVVERRLVRWPGLHAEIIAARQRTAFEYRYACDRHLLIASELSERDDGETFVEGLPPSTRRKLSRRLTLVPAGHSLYGWQQPRVLTRVNYFYIDRRGPLLDDESGFAEIEFRPRLFFFDAELWRIAAALKQEAAGNAGPTARGEELGIMLWQALRRLNDSRAQAVRGGLSGWQQKKIADFIEDNLAEDIRLKTLAGLVGLSPFHFARAFKQSFGVPPHRYYNERRMARAKALLADRTRSVTEIGLALGFAETSSFSAAFHKATGTSPSRFRRGLG